MYRVSTEYVKIAEKILELFQNKHITNLKKRGV
jgi:hypothetical protein